MYQDRDYEVIDYELFQLSGTGYRVRGPQPPSLKPNEYFTCLGAAQTFGCFAEKPFPALLSQRFGLSALNLGIAGAGPRFFLQREAGALLRYANAGRFAIVQVMSGRSEDNSRFDTRGREYLIRRSDGERIGAEPAYRDLLANESESTLRAIVEETRENWVESYTALFEAFQVPAILFWFSTRVPEYEEVSSDNIYDLFGQFPQLVNQAMVDRVRHLSDAYVECVSDRGLPQQLISRFTGEPVFLPDRADLGRDYEGVNVYYPSPQMHADAAEALESSCRAYAVPAGSRSE